ncbi:MAG TPA: cytidylate kinase-like family protein [bacterium]|nr:cytidylate kinase-like family protein [bacterium]HPR89431.1 cytidylate kinase-like family protein [bacterium]
MNETYVITIGRQLGSGGREIGVRIAGRLGIAFYDRELIEIAAQESGLGKAFFEKAEEQKGRSLFAGVMDLYGAFRDEGYSGNYLSNETLFNIQSGVISELAGRESAVFIGRCADHVLKEHARALHLFICADLQDRIARIAAIQHVPEKKAREIILKTDKQRAAYYNYFTEKAWGAAESYHLCINSSVLGIEETAAYICQFARTRFGLSS